MKLLTLLFAVTTTFATANELPMIPFNTISGTKTSLADFQGKVVLVVNTASQCGLTGQYKDLQTLQEKYEKQGFTVIGFPCNDFNNQEPGSAKEIQEFCSTKFNVTFPLMEKIHVKGDDQHPLYKALTGENGSFPGDVKWNFGKFLIGKDGKAIARFEPKQTPQSAEVIAAIEKAIATTAP